MAIGLTWLGQGGYLIRCGGVNICLDPYLSYSCENAGGHTRIAPPPIDPNALDADLFVISHDHMDHLDEGTLRKLDLAAHLFAAPATCREHLKKIGVPEDRLIAFDRGDTFCIGDCELHAVHAEHTEDSIGLVVRSGKRTLYFTTDSLYTEKLSQQASAFSPDAIITCINGRWGNMGAEEAASVAKALSVKLAIPSHYGMFAENTADPADFARALGDIPSLQLSMYETVTLPLK